ncbi:MAG: amino acid ABC transporter permease [Paracoccaceae bacterium]|nr:amino acid ABC transporter permease [Paracoccaceae bacterium]
MSTPSISFVRDAMLAQKTPPLTDRGAIKWLRENLFSGPVNSLLTILGLLALFFLIKASAPWLLHSVWNAGSLDECRTIIAGSFGDGAIGACWAMLRARWHQYIFGFYPPESYWRPILAFALLFFALAPVLFSESKTGRIGLLGVVSVLAIAALGGVAVGSGLFAVLIVLIVLLMALAWVAPERLLIVTLLYPALAFWLLWGGTIWAPVVAMAGFGVMMLVYRMLLPATGVVVSSALGLVAACIWWLFAQSTVSGALQGLLPFGLAGVESDRFGGFLLAITIGVTAIVASLPLGILLALGRLSDMFLIRTLSVGFIEFVRGVPLITMLFTASLLLQYFLPPNTNFDLILRVDILVTLFAAAYIAEVVRGGLAALPRGQYEAADALGLDYWKAQRLIILPQALKISIPGIVGSFIGLFKDTTLVGFVGLLDPLTGITKIVRADMLWKGVYWEPYIFVGAIFFVICFSMSRYSMYLERKLKTDNR